MKNRSVVPILFLAVVVLGAGCARRAQPAATPVAAPPPAAPVAAAPERPATPPPAPVAAVDLSEDEIFARKTLDQLNAEAPLGAVFFDLDMATLSDSARAQLQANAAWLKRWPSTRATIQGHCDERGTAEYNLALGERRAQAVRDYLSTLGVGSDRLAVVSMGKEMPFCYGATEDCWRQNRRGHFHITAK